MNPDAKISRVLVGVDFDEASASALKMAGVLASASKAELTVFHSAAQDAPAYFTADQIEALEAEQMRSRAETADQLRSFAGQHVSSDVRVVVEESPPQEAIVRLASSFDLVVVGTHRRHGALRWWLGSVAEAVVRRSPCPVLVVPAGAVVSVTPAMILAAGGEDRAVDAWVDALRTTFGGSVVRSLDIHQCAPDRIENADLIVLPTLAGTGSDGQFEAIAQVLKECVHPVLFVPSLDGIFERSSS
jgi:nucleotide-binding universal stress UspA family protein